MTMTMTMFLLNSGHLPSLKGVTKFYARSNFYNTHLAGAHIHEHILSLSLTYIYTLTHTHSLSLSPPLSLSLLRLGRWPEFNKNIVIVIVSLSLCSSLVKNEPTWLKPKLNLLHKVSKEQP